MGRKLNVAVIAAFSVMGAVILGKTADSAGLLKERPQAAYLTDDEESSRPAYRQLDDKEKTIYEALYRGISDKKEFIPLPFDVDGELYSKVYCLLEKQEGRFFYLGSSYYTAEKVNEAQIVYRDGLEAADSKMAELKAAEEKALKKIKKSSSDYEKVMQINDYIVHNCVYVQGDGKEYSPTAYGCLVNKEANCEGYSKAFDILAADAGLESLLITGVSDKGENHAWNQVKVDGDWYNIDVTWSDPDSGDEVRRAYFLCSDEEFMRTHTADSKLLTPNECSATKCNYYVKNNLYVKSEEGAERVIIRELDRDNKTIEMKFSDEELYKRFKQKYIDDQYIFELLKENGEMGEGTITISFKEGKEDCVITLFIDG